MFSSDFACHSPRPRPILAETQRLAFLLLLLLGGGGTDVAQGATQAGSGYTVQPPRQGAGEFRIIEVETDTTSSTGTGITELLMIPATWDRLDLDASQRETVSNLVREVQREQNRVAENRLERRKDWQQNQERFAAGATEAKQELQQLGDEFAAVLDPSQRRLLDQERERDRRQASLSTGNASGGGGGGNLGGGGGANGGPVVQGNTRWTSSQGATTTSTGVTRNTHANYQSGGEPGTVVRAVRNPALVTRLGLRPNQREHLRTLLEKAQVIDDQQRQRLGVPPLTQPEWRAENKSLKQLRSRTDEALLAVLRPDQRTRLEGLQLQCRGVLAPLLDPDFQRTLGFRPEQTATLAQWHADFERRNPLFPESILPAGPGAPRKPAGAAPATPVSPEQYQARRAALSRRVVQELLSPAQYRRYAEMRGQPIEGCEGLPPRTARPTGVATP